MHNRSMPPGGVVPELPYPDLAQAVDWLCAAFGCRERLRIADHRAQLCVGAGAVVAVQADASVAAASLMVRVADADAHHRTACAHGARVAGPPADQPYGERQYTAYDLAGHRWVFSQTIADVDPAAWGGRRGDAAAPGAPATPRQLVQAWVEAFNRTDVDALAGFYAEHAVNHQVAEHPVQGRAAIRAMFAAGFAAATMVCRVENIFEEGEWAMLEWSDPLDLHGCGFFHVVDGRIVAQRGYWDKLSFLRSQGLPLPKEP